MNKSAMADPEPHSGMPQTSPPGTQRGNVSNVASVVPHLFRLDVNLTANDTLGRDQFEQILLESFLSQDIEMHITEKITVNFKPVVTLGSSDPQSYCSYIATASPDLVCYSKSKSYDPIDGFVYASWWTPFLNVTYSLTCAYVSFDPLLYVIRETFAAFRPKVIVTIDLNVTTITLSEPSELKMLAVDDSGSLNVCHELLDLKIVSTRSSEMDDLTLAQYILTLVCVNVSMLCLLLTLMTYIRFPSLRNMAGRNNMGLCSSLLFAQASMLASARVEDTGPWCTALGISTHFLWLCMFSWSFICCFHMFRVFTAKTRLVHVTARSQLRLLLKNIAMSLLIPGLIVGTVIVTSHFSSNGDVIGYGDNKCYLDSTFLVGVAMIAPLAITTLCNMTFFIITILKIHNVRKLQQHDSFKKDDHKNLYIYIKLSTMTGLFWTVFIIAEGADVDVLRFIAVIANGLQGVFIFVSYICNKRILHLYLHSIGLKPEITSSADGKRVKTDRSALGNLAYERRKQVSRDEEADETLPDCPGKEAGDGRRSEAEHDHTD